MAMDITQTSGFVTWYPLQHVLTLALTINKHIYIYMNKRKVSDWCALV